MAWKGLTGLWWWIDRWRQSTAYMDMTLEEQGAYRNLLDEGALRGGAIPNDERILAKACGDATAWKRVRTVILKRFTLEPDGWHNETLDGVLKESARRAEKQRRWRNNRGNAVGNASGNEEGNDGGNNRGSPDPSQDPDLKAQKKERACVDAQRVEAAVTDAHTHGRKLLRNSRKLAATVAANVETADDALWLRAGDLLEHYKDLFQKHRGGARYHNRMHHDLDQALGLVKTWPDDSRLEKLAVIILTTDDEWISGTDRGFGVFAAKATWADDKLVAWEAEHQQAH